MQHNTIRSAVQDGLDRILLGCVNLWGLIRHLRQARYYRSLSGRWPDLAFPRTANDKFFWRKVFDRDPRLTTMCDKLAAKDWVWARVPDLDIPAVLWAGTDPADIPPDVLAGDVVVKVNHGWNTNLFIHDGQQVGIPPHARRAYPVLRACGESAGNLLQVVVHFERRLARLADARNPIPLLVQSTLRTAILVRRMGWNISVASIHGWDVLSPAV